MKVFGDGGANRFFDLLPQLNPGKDPWMLRLAHLPNVICGDLDSIRSDVLQFYKSQGVEIRDLSHDQDSTDTDKCIEYIKETQSLEEPIRLVVLGNGWGIAVIDGFLTRLGSLGGRLDHTLANLHTLHTYSDMDIVMIGEGNCARLLKQGRTKIKVSLSTTLNAETSSGGFRCRGTKVCISSTERTGQRHSHWLEMAAE